MKKWGMVLIGVLVLGAASSSMAATGDCAKNGKTSSYEMVMKMVSPKEQIMTMIGAFKDSDGRTETYNGQGSDKELVNIMIMKGQEMYLLNPKQKTGMKMSMNSPMAKGQKSEKQEGDWKTAMAEMKAKGYTVEDRGKEKWQGEEYEVWRVTEPNAKGYTDDYVDKNGMAKRFVTYDKSGKMLTDSWFVRFNACIALPAGTLDVPSDYKISEMPQLPFMPK